MAHMAAAAKAQVPLPWSMLVLSKRGCVTCGSEWGEGKLLERFQKQLGQGNPAGTQNKKATQCKGLLTQKQTCDPALSLRPGVVIASRSKELKLEKFNSPGNA